MRPARILALAGALAACTPSVITVTPTPTPSAGATATAPAAVSPTATASAAASDAPSPTSGPEPTPTFAPPSPNAALGIGPFKTLRLQHCAGAAACVPLPGLPAVSRSWLATSYNPGTSGPEAAWIVAVSTRDGSRVEIRHPRASNVGDLSVSGSAIAYFDFVTADGASGTWGVWRTDLDQPGASPRKLDEFPAVVFGGGDNINPWPDPITNGRDVVWRRAKDGGSSIELVLAAGVTAPRVLYTSKTIIFYAIDQLGRVAFSTYDVDDRGNAKEAVLRLYDPSGPRTVEVARRPPDQAGLVEWTAGRIAWLDSTFSVRPAAKAELFDASTRASSTFEPPTGCFLRGQATVRHLFVSCFTSHLVAAHDVATGKGAPLGPFVFAGVDAIAVRSTAEVDAGDGVWLVAAVIAP